jgi:hypothetical protein
MTALKTALEMSIPEDATDGRSISAVPAERFKEADSTMVLSGGNSGRLSFLDVILSAMDCPARPLDFALILHLSRHFSIEDLNLGARSARNLYPQVGSLRSGNYWVRSLQTDGETRCRQLGSQQEAVPAVEELLSEPFDPAHHVPVRQLAMFPGQAKKTILATRFHHAAGDGLSACLLLNHQLRVGSGDSPPVRESRPFKPLRLRSHPVPVTRNRFAFREPSDPLLSSGQGRSSRRRLLTVEMSASGLRRRSARAGISYGDLLAACALEVLRDWNHSLAPHRPHKIGLWLPVNIRRHPSAGFGNGTSRIRIYARQPRQAPLMEKFREVHRQIRCCMREGEWAVPDSLLGRLPYRLAAPLLRCYLSRPWVDMGTAVFTHLDLVRYEENWIEKVEAVAQLHPRHKMGLTAVSLGRRTWLTLTFDPAALSAAETGRMADHFLELIEKARKELP